MRTVSSRTALAADEAAGPREGDRRRRSAKPASGKRGKSEVKAEDATGRFPRTGKRTRKETEGRRKRSEERRTKIVSKAMNEM